MPMDRSDPLLDQLIRQTRAHHVQLSMMADIKANILLTVAALNATFAAGYLDNDRFFWPAVTLIAFCVPTILFAIYAVMPKTSLHLRRRGHHDLRSPSFNLLFFGDFADMEYEAYLAALREVLVSPESAYEVMIREIFILGQFLMRKKYRYLRIAYIFFMAGISCSGVCLAYEIFAAAQL